MPGGEGRISGETDERRRVREGQRRALAADRVAEDVRHEVGEEIPEQHVEKDRRPPPVERRDRGDDEEDRALDADSRERDEDRVEPFRPMVDDPALEPCIEIDYGPARP
jgi:hypothetical protein